MAPEQSPLFPLPEPPAEAVAQLLDLLRTAKRELREAGRIVELLSMDNGPGERSVRDSIELDVAERRAQLWASEVRTIERSARALGIDVRSTL
jgi:hypothetical protein